MIRIKIIVFFLIGFVFCNAQLSKEVEKEKAFEDYKLTGISYEGMESLKKLLLEIASNEKLYYLANEVRNPYIKAVAIGALANKKDERVYTFFKNSLDSKDSLDLGIERGCIRTIFSYPAYLFSEIISSVDSTDRREVQIKLSKIILDKEPINIKLIEESYLNIPAQETYYSRIKDLVSQTHSKNIAAILAQYRKEEDIELIKSLEKNAFLAIEGFPHEEFLPFLKNHVNESGSYQYMFALSKYCNEKSQKIVEKIIDKEIKNNEKDSCGNTFLETIYRQIERNQCKLYYPLLENFWLKSKIISFRVLENYKSTHSRDQIENFLFSGLMLPGEPVYIKKNLYIDDFVFEEDNLMFNYPGQIAFLLKELKKYSQKKYEKALRYTILEIEGADVNYFVEELNDNESLKKNKDIFLEKMKKNDSAYGLLIIMEAMKALNDKNLFLQGFEIIKQRKEEFDNGIWQESLQGFLKENRLKLE